MIRASFLAGGMLLTQALTLTAQELFVMTEPASNMPSGSVSAKVSAKFIRDRMFDRTGQRYGPEVMFGLSKKWMVHGAATFSNMYSASLRPESGRVYAKYRFYSDDDVHRHFRMAAFAEASHSRNGWMYDEISLEGDQSGVTGGVVATQLWNRLAVSSTLSYVHVLGSAPKGQPNDFVGQAYNYSLSGGYLLLPAHYTSFNQTNVNLYMELLGQRATDRQAYYVDAAPSLQVIFNSNMKLNIGYRFQLAGDMNRMAEQGFVVAVERTFLDALKH